MARIEETRLPGIGVRHEFTTSGGTRVGVVTFREGPRELVILDDKDPDKCRATLPLSEGDARMLAELLAGLREPGSREPAAGD